MTVEKRKPYDFPFLVAQMTPVGVFIGRTGRT